MKPYYEHAGITIYHGDCREILPTLQPVDLVFTSPPYAEQRTYTGACQGPWASVVPAALASRTIPKGPDGAPMDKQQAQRAVFQLRRKAVNSAFKSERVNKTICNCRNPKKATIICARPAGHSGPHEAYRDSWWEET